MATLFAAKVETSSQHLIDDVLITHRSANNLSPALLERSIQASVAHDSGDDGLMGERFVGKHIERRDDHNVVSVDQYAGLIAKQDAVSIAIMGNSNICAQFADLRADELGVHGTAFLINIGSVRLIAKNENLGA